MSDDTFKQWIREAYVEAGGDTVEAESILRKRAEAVGMDAASIICLIKLGIALWKLLKKEGYISIAPDHVGRDLVLEDENDAD